MAAKSTSHTSTQRSSRKHQSHTSRALLLLHLAITVCALPAIILTIVTVALWNANFFHKTGALRGDWADGLLLIPLTLSFTVSLTHTIKAFLIRRRQRQRQKGTHTGDDYLRMRTKRHTISIFPMLGTITILALLVPLLALAGTSGLFRLWQPTVSSLSLKSTVDATPPPSALTLPSTSTLSLSALLSAITKTQSHITTRSLQLAASKSSLSQKHCTLSEIFTRPCNPTLFTIGSLQLSIISLSSLIWLLELAIFFQQIKHHRHAKRKRAQGLRYKARAMNAEKSPTHAKPTHPARRYTYKPKSTPPVNPSAPAIPSPTQSRERAGLNRTASDSSTSSHFSNSQTSNNATPPSRNFSTRPKQYHYDPQISRSRSQREREHNTPVADPLGEGPRIARSPPTYIEGSGVSDADHVAAVEEVRLKLRPSETMGAYLAARYA